MVLEDHERKGKKLFHPILSSTNFQQTSWHMERLPELFWLALICSRFGHKESFKVTKDFAQDIQSTIRDVRNNDIEIIRAYVASEHKGFSKDECQQIVEQHSDANWYKKITPIVSEMLSIWPDHPFKYLVNSELTKKTSEAFVKEVKELLGVCGDRHERLALMIQSIPTEIDFQLGFMTLAEGLNLPDFNELENYPNSRQSQIAAGFVVNMSNSIVVHISEQDFVKEFDWPRIFWNCCYKLQECEYE